MLNYLVVELLNLFELFYLNDFAQSVSNNYKLVFC